jgi:hypothetical protein
MNTCNAHVIHPGRNIPRPGGYCKLVKRPVEPIEVLEGLKIPSLAQFFKTPIQSMFLIHYLDHQLAYMMILNTGPVSQKSVPQQLSPCIFCSKMLLWL